MLFETKRLCDNRSSFFVTVASVQEGADYVYIITLAEELENSKSYKITFDGTEQIIRMSFSMAKDGPWRPM